ncbi:hypothetical protein ACIBJE_02245 [Micromonospora sp. NPDC050187]|uniref:hypothetical protein n=1 Tax=Micromonospora sp. NPDC050187 TaxID=3364277 RepID=UPI0037BA2BC2
MTAAEAATLIDAGTCRWCPHGQWSHKRGKGGCRELDCVCDKYEAPKGTAPAPADDWPLPVAEVESAEAAGLVVRAESPANEAGVPVSAVERAEPERTRAELVADLTAQSIELGTYDLAVPAGVRTPSTCAYPNGEDEGEHDHALCEDVVAERAEPAAAAAPTSTGTDRTGQVIRDVGRAVAADIAAQQDEIRRLRIQLRAADGTIADQKRKLARVERERDKVRAELTEVAGERDEAVVQRDQAYERVEEQDIELGRVRAALIVAVDEDPVEAIERLRARLTGARERVGELERCVARLLAPADVADPERVLWAYDARQCQTCGSRYTADVDHEHPLTPVTVLIVRRGVAA